MAIRTKKFIPPTFQELESYCALKGFKNIARKVYDYYSEGDWNDSTGKPVLNWKQKLIAVWFDDKNRDSTAVKPGSVVYSAPKLAVK